MPVALTSDLLLPVYVTPTFSAKLLSMTVMAAPVPTNAMFGSKYECYLLNDAINAPPSIATSLRSTAKNSISIPMSFRFTGHLL
jgi:hypothetical protein